MSARAVATVLSVLALLAPIALAQEPVGPEGSDEVAVGSATLYHWPGTRAAVDRDVALGANASIWFALGPTANRTLVFLNVTANATTLAIPNGTVTFDSGNDATPRELALTREVPFSVTVADAGVVNVSYAFTGEAYEDQNGTLVLLGPVSGSGAFTVDVGAFVPVPPTEPGGIPRPWLLAGLAVLVVGGGAAVVVGRQRATKRRMNEGPRRSQVMREMELEQKLEKAKAKDPEAAVVIQQEIRQAEQVREKRRELQILEAKRADALKTLDLLQKRHEAGGLTKLQYDNMVAKKRQDLARIEAEIQEMERADSGSAA